jgi:histidyl-tRNA synthetase
VGWAAGVERLAMLTEVSRRDRLDFVIVPMGEAAETFCTNLIADLRRRNIYCDMAYRGNLKKRMQRADAAGASHAIIVGDDELAKGEIAVRDLKTGEQAKRKLTEVLLPGAGATYTFIALTKGPDGIAAASA